MKPLHKKVDERQELELLRIGNLSYWLLFFALSISFILQITFFDITIFHILPEAFCLLIGTGAILVGYIAKGQWGACGKPSIKLNFVTSFLTAVLYIIITLARTHFTAVSRNDLLPVVVIRAIPVFLFVFIVLGLSGYITQKKSVKLTQKYEDEDIDL